MFALALTLAALAAPLHADALRYVVTHKPDDTEDAAIAPTWYIVRQAPFAIRRSDRPASYPGQAQEYRAVSQAWPGGLAGMR